MRPLPGNYDDDMRRALLALLAAGLAAATNSPAQSAPFKDEVDGLIRTFRNHAPKGGGFGDGSALQTAQVLTAMGYCHRFYSFADGPVVRPGLNHLVAKRGTDGLYRDGKDSDAITTTAWVLEAMAVLAPREFARELADGATALQQKGQDNLRPFGARLEQLRTLVQDAKQAPEVMKKQGAAVATQVAEALRQGPDRKADAAADAQALLHLVACQVVARGQTPSNAPVAAAAPAQAPAWHPVQQKGADYLLAQLKDGVVVMPIDREGKKFAPEPGLTSMALAALQTKPAALRTEAEKQAIASGLAWLVQQQRADGSFSEANVNYIACAAVLALTAANDPAHKAPIEKARNQILGLQNTEGRGYARSDRDYGSIGYGGDERGDISNLQFSLEALRKGGLDPKQSDAFEKALVFLQRCQNLQSHNDMGKVVGKDEQSGEERTYIPGNDGGSAYYPGNSPMGYIDLPSGERIPRSYGSMTYALLKAYTLCGLDKSDPRLQAAIAWIGKNWNLDENPGADPKAPEALRFQGLFYYYMVLAQALDTAGVDKLEVPAADPKEKARQVDWRTELRGKMESIQLKDGSWVNSKNGRWYEMLGLTCTCYVLLALDRCK